MLKNTEFWMIQLVLTDFQGLYAEIIAEYPAVKDKSDVKGCGQLSFDDL